MLFRNRKKRAEEAETPPPASLSQAQPQPQPSVSIMSSYASSKSAPGPAPLSILSGNLRVTGSLVTEGDIQIDGIVEGDVTSGSVTVGSSGSVSGEIRADTARILGRVQGRILARSVMLMSTAHVEGDVHHETISIENGARIEGRYGPMKPKAEVATTPTAPKRVAIAHQTDPVES
jgi:cytoskeletal protein CcmA (bactofilin family)